MSKTNTALVSDSDQSSDDEPLRPKPRESLSGLGQPPSSKQSSSNKSESATPSIANSPSKTNQKQRQRESSSMSNTSNKPKKRRKRLFSNRSDSRRKKNKLNIQEQEDEVELYHPYMDPEPGTEEDSDGSQASWNKEDAEEWQKYRLERKDQDTDGVFEVEDILRWRLHPRTRKVQYRTTWSGYSIYAEWLLESQFDDKSLIKAFWKAHGGRPASLPKLESSVENHQLDPSDTDEAAYKHPISKAKRARKKIRTEVRRDKKIVRQKKAQVESKKEQGSDSSASSPAKPETRNGKEIGSSSENQLQDTSTEKTACLSSSADDDSDDIPLQPQRKRQRTQSQKTSSNLPQFTKKKQNTSVEPATSYPAAEVSDSEEEWVPRPEAKQQQSISQQKGRVQAEVSDSDSDSDSDEMWKPPDQQALKEKPSATRGASTSSTASPEKALDQGQLKQPPQSVPWKGAHKRDPRVKLDDPVGPKASSSKYGITTSQPSLSSTASISKASLLPSKPSENNTKSRTNGIGLSASPTHLSASTPSPIGNKFASSKSSGQVNLHPTQASSTFKIPLQEKLGISGTALEVITSGLHDHFVIGPVGGDDTLAALLEVSKCSSLGASNLAKELGRPSAIWIEYQTRYILERGWLPEREMSEIKRKAIGECLHSAKLRYSAQFFLYGNFPSGQLFQATSAFPKQGGGIVTFTLAGLLHYAIHSNQAFMELAEVFHFGQLQELPPGMVRGFRLWSLKEELPPSWEVVIHPWIIAFLEDFLGKGQLAQVIEKFGIVGQGGASRPPGLIDEMIDNLPEFARKLDWDETCSQDAHAPAAESMLQVFAALDQEVISTMRKLQRLTMREKRFHVILTPDGSLVKGHHKGTEFGGVGIMEIEGLRRLAADQSQW